LNQVNSVEQFISVIEKQFGTYEEKYFRGQLEKWKSIPPSIARDEGYRENESRFYTDTLEIRPNDFEGLNSPIEKLSKMQHYEIPTRLIDVTINPLKALYFAVEDTKCTSHGNVLVYIREGKNFNDNHVRTLALLATISDASRQNLCERFYTEYGHAVDDEFLLNFATTPTFVKHCDELKKSNQRLYEQDGAFFICSNVVKDGVLTNDLVTLDSFMPSMLIRVPYEYKSHIKSELNEKHGINAASIYPELPSVSTYLKEKYRRKTISLDDKYEIIKESTNENMRGRRWGEFFVVLKKDEDGKPMCGRNCSECKSRPLAINHIKEIVKQIIRRSRSSNEVISIFVANSNEDYVSINWILRAQWTNSQLADFLKPMPIGKIDNDSISWVENKSYSIRTEFHEKHSFVDDVHLYVYNYKTFQTFKRTYAEMKQSYQRMSLPDFMQKSLEWENAIVQCSFDFGDFGISKNKCFNEFLEIFLIVSGAADNLRMYRADKSRTLQNLQQVVKYDFEEIEKHLPLIEKGLNAWKQQIGVTDSDIENINFQRKEKPQFNFIQTIPISENAVDIYIDENVFVLPDNKIQISGATNLFDEANILLTVKGENGYSAQGKTIVANGKFEFSVFSNSGEGLDRGTYKANIMLSISGTQPCEFVKFAGIEYENLTGSLVRRDGLAPVVEYCFNFEIP